MSNCCQQNNLGGENVGQRDASCWCSSKVICFLVALLLATLGLIFGALYAATLLTALAALIVLAVVLFILIVAVLIYYWCKCCRHRCG